MSPTYLCVGGPLDGQYRSMAPDCLSFRVAYLLPTVDLAVSSGRPMTKVTDDSIEYQLVWSSEHDRMVWWCDQ